MYVCLIAAKVICYRLLLLYFIGAISIFFGCFLFPFFGHNCNIYSTNTQQQRPTLKWSISQSQSPSQSQRQAKQQKQLKVCAAAMLDAEFAPRARLQVQLNLRAGERGRKGEREREGVREVAR